MRPKVGPSSSIGETWISARFEAEGDGHRVTWQIGEASEAPHAFTFETSTRNAATLRKIEQGTCIAEDLRDIGVQLWDGLAPSAIAAKIRAAVSSAEAPLTLVLLMPERLTHLPWETLYDDVELRYIACHPSISLVHGVGDDLRPVPPPADRLSVLVVIPEGTGLDVETEWSNLRASVAKLDGAAELFSLRGPVCPDRLSEELLKRHWSVVHFIGHGQIRDNRVEIRLNDESGNEVWSGADAFSALFLGTKVDLCILNCCHGGATSNVRSMDRLAPGLLAAGVRSVVAMRFAMADADAIRFSNIFYHQLLRGAYPGRPTYAAQLARKSLLSAPSRDEHRGFVTPVVHIRGRSTTLFALRPREARITSPPTETPTARACAPAALAEAVAKRRCIPIIGPELVAPPDTRRGPAVTSLRSLVEKLTNALADQPHERATVAIPPTSPAMPVDAILRRLAERFDACGQWQRMATIVREFYAPHQPSELHRLLASWRSPGAFYTHFDGLMEAALPAQDRVTVIRDLTQGVEVSDALLVLVRGTITEHRSLVLTENDHFDLGERIERMHQTLCSVVRGHLGRCVVFIGQSPACPVARQLARKLLDPGPRGPEAFFVCNQPLSDDEWFWRRYNVEFVRADNEALIRAITPGQEA
jgi:hypothetical protein